MAISRVIAAIVLLFCILVCVDAHGWMSSPKPRGQFKSTPRRPDEEYAPVIGDANNIDFVCRQDPVMPQSAWSTFTAGTQFNIEIGWNALHPGGCFLYLTYDGDKSVDQQNWFKIWEHTNCIAATSYTITMPNYLPSASHAILRWEWYGLHRQNAGVVEWYAQCSDIKIMGIAGGTLPQPQVKMPGHLPIDATKYWDPYNGATEFLTGPPLATQNGQPITPAPATATTGTAPTTTPSTTSSATKTPTTKPTTTPTNPTTTPTNPTPNPTTKPTANPACTVGAKTCPCTAGGGCDKGLTCVSSICVDLSEQSAIKGSASSVIIFMFLIVVCLAVTLL